MPKYQNSYGNRALDLEFDTILKRLKAVEDGQAKAALAVNSTPVAQTVVQPGSNAAPAAPSFAAQSKWWDVPPAASVPVGFVTLSKWEAG